MTKGRPSIIRIGAVVAVALMLALQVVRSALFDRSIVARPELAEQVWPGHPRVQLALALSEIGEAAGAGRLPSEATIARSTAAASRAPLAIEPLLIASAVAQSEARDARAEALLVEASRRDPRSSAARFLLAQRYFSTGRPAEGLAQASVLVRLAPGAREAMIPAIAQYARSPGALPALRRMFADDPKVRDAVLAELARDAGNYALVLSLAGAQTVVAEAATVPAWQTQLLHALIERGEYAKAHALWLRISGLRAGPAGIFNPTFAKLAAPPPFNWAYGSGDFGVAEPAGVNRLQIIYYGRSNAEFATQTMVLRPGTYQLRMRVTRDAASGDFSSLAWTASCLPAGKPILTLPIGNAKGPPRAIGARFVVPDGCASQQLRLTAVAVEFPSSEQVAISDLQLVRLTP